MIVEKRWNKTRDNQQVFTATLKENPLSQNTLGSGEELDRNNIEKSNLLVDSSTPPQIKRQKGMIL